MGYPEGWSADGGCYEAPMHDTSDGSEGTTPMLPEGYREMAVTDGVTTWTNHPHMNTGQPYAAIPEQK